MYYGSLLEVVLSGNTVDDGEHAHTDPDDIMLMSSASQHRITRVGVRMETHPEQLCTEPANTKYAYTLYAR